MMLLGENFIQAFISADEGSRGQGNGSSFAYQPILLKSTHFTSYKGKLVLYCDHSCY